MSQLVEYERVAYKCSGNKVQSNDMKQAFEMKGQQ